MATTFGYGPRFLHSTGQLHKGGPNNGLFLQIVDETILQIVDETPLKVVDETTADLAVPETDYSFGALIRAQSVGDFQALRQKERRVLCLGLAHDVPAGLRRLRDTLASILAYSHFPPVSN
jgi:transaldolase/glucose-6-phosphate isomerase